MPAHWNGTPFVRVYSTLKDDHADVWFDKLALGWFVTLLGLVEPIWPASADMPGDLPGEVLELLVLEGLIDTRAAGRLFRVPSLDAERADRGEGRRIGGKARAEQAERTELGTFAPANEPATASKASKTPATATSNEPAKPASINAGQPASASKPARTNQPAEPTSQPAAPAGRLAGSESERARGSSGPAALVVNPRLHALDDPPTVSTIETPADRWARSRPPIEYCVEPDAHRGEHWHMVAGKHRCMVCERARADDDPLTFREKVERAARATEPEGMF